MSNLTSAQAARRERTLRTALLLSLWAPLATGLAVLHSHSTTQLADFIRRTVELAALLVSWLVFRYLSHRNPIPEVRTRLERAAGLSVAAALACSGLVMLGLALYRVTTSFRPGGNVIPGLAIAGLGVLTNGWFWWRYAGYGREQPDAIIEAQRQMYQAKTSVDLCVVAALAALALFPAHPFTRHFDLLGTTILAGYLLWSGARTAFHRLEAGNPSPSD